MTLEFRDIEEIWKDVIGYEGLYQVSNLGRVKSLPKQWKCGGGKNAPLKEFSHNGKILKQTSKSNGYYYVCLSKNNKASYLSVHKIVAGTFIDNFGNKPQVNHINGDKLDNRVENLEWVTAKENIRHAIATGLANPTPPTPMYGEKHGHCKLTTSQVNEIKELRKKGHTYRHIATLYNYHYSNVARICNGKFRTKG